MISTSDRRRLLFLSLFVFFLFSLLIAQYYKIQIIEGEKWTKAALRQHQISIVEPFKRGVFYSNTAIKKGHPESPQPFVIDVPKFHLYADPQAIPLEHHGEIAAKIVEILHLEAKDKEKLKTQLGKKSRSRKLVVWLSRENHENLLAWWQPFAKRSKIARNALFFVQEYKRSYPFGKLLGQALHTLREDKDPITRQSIPTGGLELSLNRYLQGKEGKRVMLRSPRHPLDFGEVVKKPEDGADVYLSVNHCIQAIAEEEIAKAVQNANAKSGFAVMMEPKTGEILAFAQYPWFEPAKLKSYFNDPKLVENTKPKAIIDPYEPGSTMKPITLAVALAANKELKKRGKPPLFSPLEKISTAAGIFPGRGKPLKDLHFHRFLNMYMGLQKSSNIYMAKLVQRIIEALGEEWYRNALKEMFGFGEKTGVELFGESPGLLPLPGKKHPGGAPEWSKATPYSLAMGHNILVNSLQMLRAYGAIANGGKLVHPTLVRKIVKGKEILVDHTAPQRVEEFAQVLDPEIVEQVKRAMKFVTKPGGSARRADIPGYSEAGKTGTSEKIVGGVYSKKNHISTFVGFSPVDNPAFVLLIAIDEPECKFIPGIGKNQQAGVCCAPAFRQIGLRTLQYLGIAQDDPENKDWHDKIKELKALYDQWNH